MKRKIIYISQKLGIDESIFWSLINKGFGVIRAPLLVFFIIQYMTVEEQGQWYTFTSLSALTMLADLGFASIVTHFVSHEYAWLKFNRGILEGPEDRLDRFMGFAKFSIRFYLKVTFVTILILLSVGGVYFYKENADLLSAWAAFSFIGGIGLMIALLQAIYQGVNKVKEIQINTLINSFFITFFTCLALYLKMKLWALVIGNVFGLFFCVGALYWIGRDFWKQVFFYKVRQKYFFLKETIALQIRYTVSFITTYLISFLYVPVIYKYIGAKPAGQFGLLISVVGVISSIAYSWTATKVPTFNILVSTKNYKELDHIVKTATYRAAIVFVGLSLLLMAVVFIIHTYFHKYAERIPDVSIIILYILSQFIFIIINSFTLYLRAFKKEPLVWVQVLNALLLLSAIFFVLKVGCGLTPFLIAVNTFSWLIILPVAIYVFIKYRKLFLKQYA